MIRTDGAMMGFIHKDEPMLKIDLVCKGLGFVFEKSLMFIKGFTLEKKL